MTAITGIGWIAETEYGCVRRQLRRPYSDMKSLRSKLQDDSVFLYPVKSFGKYDRVSQMACCVVALAFYDAEMSYSESRKQDVGILGTNSDGCLQSNLDFFEDFVRNGRTLGRANLFVYTLPSIPVAEAAIYFKCQGPLLYMTFPKAPVASMLSFRSQGRVPSSSGCSRTAMRWPTFGASTTRCARSSRRCVSTRNGSRPAA